MALEANNKISVVIPVYNAERYLSETINSVLSQTYSNLELILVNDGSTDGSPGIIRSFMEKDPRVRMIDKKNGGYGQSVNMGFDAARGEYLGIVEADDFAAPEMFERLYSQAKENGVDVMKGQSVEPGPDADDQMNEDRDGEES